MENRKEIELRVPGRQEYALVIRTALGGVAILKDLDIGTLDDIRMAADEACDFLLHQGAPVEEIDLSVEECGDGRLCVALSAVMNGGGAASEDELALSQAVLETLAPEVVFDKTEDGCVHRIRLYVPKAAV